MILSIIFGFIAGIGIGSFFNITVGFILSILLLSIIFFIYKNFVSEDYKRFIMYGAFLLLGVFLGFTRIYFSDLNQESKLAQFANQKVSAEGIVVEEPDVRESNMKLTVMVTKISPSDMMTSKPSANADGHPAPSKMEFREKILVTASIYPEYKYGDKILLENLKLSEPKEIESDGRTFDYIGYLRARGIWYTASFVKISLISSGHGSIIKTGLFKIKKTFTNALDLAISQPESSLMAGLLLGTKQSLGKELLNEFSRAGVSHVVVLSGYNIAIVAESIMALLIFLPAAFAFGIGCISIILFTILSGGGASAVRAAIMVLVALFAKKMNRDYKASRAFGFAVVLMLAPNPLLLVFDPSFQLSALATIGLIFVSPFIVPYLLWVTERFGLREIFSSTIATQLTVLPFLIYNTGVLSLVSLPVNILILGTVPTTMFLGFVTGLFGLVSLWLSFIPAFFSYIFLWYQLKVVHIGATLPFGTISLQAFSPMVLILVYGVIGAGLYWLNKRKSQVVSL